MHELSVCQSIVSQVSNLCQEHQAKRVSRITVAIGPLSGVEEKLLVHAFPMASQRSPAEGAEFVTEITSLKVHCNTCGKESDVSMSNLTCRHCGDWQTQVISGDELLLKQVELDFDEVSAAADA